jgi:hypothetical protein
MREMKTICIADLIATDAVSHLRNLDVMPVVVSAPGSRSAMAAFWRDSVAVRVHPQFSAVATGSAAAVGFHGILLPISAAARTMQRRTEMIFEFSSSNSSLTQQNAHARTLNAFLCRSPDLGG